MKTDNSEKLVDAVFSLLRLLKRTMSLRHTPTRLSILQIQALMFLKFNEQSSMGDIAQNFSIELPSATSLINKLYRQKLVNRVTDAKDRRLVRLVLTPQGKAALARAVRERRTRLKKVLSYLSETEREQLRTILESLHKRLEHKDEK